MTAKPYQMVRRVREAISLAGTPPLWDCHLELTDTPNISEQKEWLAIRTCVSPPLPNHPQALELAALLRARDLLEQQINAMQSL
jgi:hypothetical protein